MQKCLPIISDIPKDINFSGIITGFKHPREKGTGSYAFLDLRTQTMHSIKAGSYTSEIAVSPDRTLYAYGIDEANQVAIFTADRRIKKVVAVPYRWFIMRWFDNQRLLMMVSEPDPFVDPSFRFTDKYPETIAMLNPFTGEKIIFPPNYPDIDRAIWHNFDSSGSTLYDPTLTRVVYPGSIEGKGGGYILWDIQGKRKLAELYSPNPGISPKWSEDGSRFVVSGEGGELYLISRDGDIQQITHYNPNYDPKKPKYHYWSEHYSWSPDGKQLAMWLGSSLAVLDIATGETRDFCISYGGISNYPTYLYPVWSPDGKSIIVDANHQPDQNTDDLILVDLGKNSAIKIAENFSPNGWLKERIR
jgi:hypothetical protein